MITPRVVRFRTFRAPSFGAQVVLGMILVAVSVALAAGLLIHHLERQYLDALLAHESSTKFELLISASQDDIVSRDIPRLQTSINTAIARDQALYAVHIVDDQGHLLYYRHDRGEAVPPRLLSMDRAIRIDGENFGTVSVAWDIGRLERGVGGHSYEIAAVVGGMCVLLAVLAYLAIRGLAVAPIQRMARRLNEFQGGTFDRIVELPAFAPGELQRLNASINTLGEMLAQKEQRDQERIAAKEAAIAANRTKSEFLANMSHELRTPLNAILGFSDVLKEQTFGPLGNIKYRGYVNDIRTAGHHLLQLINDILDVCKIESGKVELIEEEIPIELIIAASMRFIKPRAADAGVHLGQSLPSSLPHLLADETKLKQILLNLLANAVKFTHRGGAVMLTVMLDHDKGIIFEVADTGIGIPPDMIAKVLEPFAQVANPLTKRHEGAGLGLPLAKALVELHGGSLELESTPGAGTVVRFTLPPSRFLQRPVQGSNVVQLQERAALGPELPEPRADIA
jgi:signal transduction histidine kinase